MQMTHALRANDMGRLTLKFVAVFGDIIFLRSASRDLRKACIEMMSGKLSCRIAAILAFACHAELSYPMLASPKDKCLWANRSRFCSFFSTSLLRSFLDLQAVGVRQARG